MNRLYIATIAMFVVGFAMESRLLLAQGTLDPPTNALVGGVPVATMKTMDQVEPRTLISRLPFSIVRPGSYYLASPLDGIPGSNGITIAASNVRLDLSGFPLKGTGGSLSGIAVIQASENIVVRNGVVHQWGKYGLDASLARGVVISDLKAITNGWGGLYAGADSLVERCAAYHNGFTGIATNPPTTDGIQVGAFSSIIDCKSGKNKGAGIHTYEHSRILGCTATESLEANGIWAESYCTIRDCTTARNANHGIRVASMCRVTENTSAENGYSGPATNAAGIAVEGSNNLIEKNILAGNDMGIFVPVTFPFARGNLIINNAASKNGIDFRILDVSNYVGPLEQFMAGNAFTNTNPWANFRFSGF